MTQRTKKVLWGSAGTFIALFPALMLAHVEGPDVRHTGGPGDVQMSCGDPAGTGSGSCHTSNLTTGGPINAFGGSVTATFSTGKTYTPGGGPITITVTVTDPTAGWSGYYGFQMSARMDSDTTYGAVGHFAVGAPNQAIFCDHGAALALDNNFEGKNGCGNYVSGPAVGKPVVEFMEHAFPSMTSSAQTTPYTFTWTPPATDVGPIHFYLAGNAVNNDHKADGKDHVYTNSYVLTSAAALPPPSITLVANAEGEAPTIAPNTWIEIKGTNLAPVGDTRIWAAPDFINNQMPTNLDGVSVTVNGKNAFIWYISPTQVNVLTPPDALSGPVNVVLTTSGGSSTPVSVPTASMSSSFFVFDGTHVAAVHLNGSLLGPTTLYPGSTTPAKPGETIVVFGNGFGATSTPVVSGSPTQGGTLSPTPTIKIGGVSAQVTFAGLVAPGEYQFNVVVPQVADGDQSITASYNGTTTQSGAVLTVKN